jgi:hypothetical protein
VVSNSAPSPSTKLNHPTPKTQDIFEGVTQWATRNNDLRQTAANRFARTNGAKRKTKMERT